MRRRLTAVEFCIRLEGVFRENMKKTRAVFVFALVAGLGGFLFPAVSQVRVTAVRAAVYAEPSRNSSRIDVVPKGSLLNLFQQQKVKDIWYYVSYNSPRYGGRVSGFILDSAVEPVSEEAAPAEKPASPTRKIEPEPEAKVPPPAEPAKPEPQKAAAEPPKTEPQTAPARRVPLAMPKIVEYKETMAATRAPRPVRITLPRLAAGLEDQPWAIIQPPAPVSAKPTAVLTAPTPAVASKTDITKEKPKPVEAKEVKKTQAAKKSPAPSPPPVVRESAAKKEIPREAEPVKAKPETERPAPTPAPTAPQARPAQPARPPSAGPRPARLAIGLGYGPSFGGAGGSLEFYLSRSLALHAGYGVYPTGVIYSETDWVKNETMWSAGLRFYLMPSSEKLTPYLDAQYGGLSVEAAEVITGIYDYSYIYSHEQKVLWGPSLLAGLELRFGRLALRGGLGVSYSLTDWQYLKNRVLFAFEAGLGVRL